MVLNLNARIAAASSIPIDLSPVVPERFRGQSLSAIGQATVFCGNREAALTELFEISGRSDRWRASSPWRFVECPPHWRRYDRWENTHRWSVGRHLGAQMCGGQIEVSGDAGDWLGAEIHGGRIHVHCNAGDNVGSAYPGSPRGMSGGEILIDGAAGDGLGEGMRRGLIVVRGRAGHGVGARMIAGTILIGGECGPNLGAGMRRGTIVLTSSSAGRADMLPLTFVRGNRWNPSFVRLLSVHLQQAGFDSARDWIDSEFTVDHGDGLTLGKAEILVRA